MDIVCDQWQKPRIIGHLSDWPSLEANQSMKDARREEAARRLCQGKESEKNVVPNAVKFSDLSPWLVYVSRSTEIFEMENDDKREEQPALTLTSATRDSVAPPQPFLLLKSTRTQG